MKSKYKGQSRLDSLIEQFAMVSTGMFIAFSVTQGLCLIAAHTELLSLEISMASNLVVTMIMTVVSIGRGFCVRRLFEYIHKGQSFTQSLTEVVANRLLGLGTGVAAIQTIAFVSTFTPGFALDINVETNILLTIIITICSTMNGQYWRRVFNSRSMGKTIQPQRG